MSELTGSEVLEHTNKASKVAVLGGGSFGTALANVLADNNRDVIQWMRSSESADQINNHHRNERFFPNLDLNPAILATTDIEKALTAVDTVYVVVPSAVIRDVLKQCVRLATAQQIWVSCTKGIEQQSFLLMSQIIQEELPGVAVGVLSGPNFAQEILEKQPTASVIASTSSIVCDAASADLGNSYFRIYANDDVYGVELAGALKNIYAIAAGMASAAGTGENTRSLLITRGLAEMSRLAHVLGANPMTFIGLAGVGDLLGTCSSSLSRNYQVGYAIGSGEGLNDVVGNLGQTAEGVNTVRSVKVKADEVGVYMPLVSGLHKILFEGIPWESVVLDLMQGAQAKDVEFVAK